MNTPDPKEPEANITLLPYLDRGLITTREWWMLWQIETLAAAIRSDQFKIIPGSETTRRKSRCSVCGDWYAPGLRKFWVGHWVQLDPECLDRIQKEANHGRE